MRNFNTSLCSINLKALNVFIFVLIATSSLFAQDYKGKDTDELFEMAKEEAFNGDREKSREILTYILSIKPDYADVRILLGRTYSWDGKRSEASEEFRKVLSKDAENIDAINALVDVQMWGDDYEGALSTVKMGLNIAPTFEDFLFKKASILNSMKDYDGAMVAINELLTVNPASERGLQLRDDIKSIRLRYNISALMGVDFYNEIFDPSLYSSLQLTRNNNWGSSIFRINFANRFQTTGYQSEIDLFPTLGKGVYAYLNYGYSTSDLFPKHRIGAEVHSKLPKSFEGSLGFRYMLFNPNEVVIFSGSLGWYHKSYWFSLRPFITPDENAGTAVSLGLIARKYFGNPNNHINFNGGFGYSPDVRIFQGVPSETIFTLKSQRIGLGWQKQWRYNFIAAINVDLTNQQFIFDADNYILITSIYGQLIYRFSLKNQN